MTDLPVGAPTEGRLRVTLERIISHDRHFQEVAAKRERVVPEDYVMHKIRLRHGVLLVEHLTTLSGLAALPGRQRGGTGPASAWITDSLA
jgi:hypothetical protein